MSHDVPAGPTSVLGLFEQPRAHVRCMLRDPELRETFLAHVRGGIGMGSGWSGMKTPELAMEIAINLVQEELGEACVHSHICS
jgi:hypothetical protein